MFRFNPASPHAWAEAIDRHRRGDGEPLATMMQIGDDEPAAAREYLCSLVVATAKRRRGHQPRFDVAKFHRDKRIQDAFTRRRLDDPTISQDAAILDVVDSIEGSA